MSASFTLLSPAKINLALDVFEREHTTNYHVIKTVFQEISLADEIEFFPVTTGVNVEIEYKVENAYFNPCYNSLLDAAWLLKKHIGKTPGVILRIKKHIPVQSGFGGGSSNAATVLQGLNKLWNLNLSLQQLTHLAVILGMDVPFFLHRGTALGEHWGEKITPLPSLPHQLYCALVFPPTPISSSWAYRHIERFNTGGNGSLTKTLVEGLRKKRTYIDHSLFHNDFDALAFGSFPVYRTLFDRLYALGAGSVHLCGSGGAVYGVFETRNMRDTAVERAKKEFGWSVGAEFSCPSHITAPQQFFDKLTAGILTMTKAEKLDAMSVLSFSQA